MTTTATTTSDTVTPPTETEAAPLATKGARTAMNKCLNAVDGLDDDERARVIRALAALFGVERP
jgi:hypothetical protein